MRFQKNIQMLGVSKRKVEAYKSYVEALSDAHNNADEYFSGSSALSYGK